MTVRSILLDPGHGGKDSGAVGPTRLRESDVNLAVALALGKRLLAHNFKVSYTRISDIFPTLTERWQQANREGVDFFVSVHCNSDGPTAVGIETLHHTSSGVGRALATHIQREMITRTGDRDRGLKSRNNLAVLNGTNMPAVLPEIGFISHSATEAKFRQQSYLDLIADAIGRGIAAHLGLSWQSNAPPVPAPPAPPEPEPVPPPLEPEESEPGEAPNFVFSCPHCAKRISVSFGPNAEIDVEST